MSCTIKATYIYLSFYNISQSVLVLLNMAQSSTYTVSFRKISYFSIFATSGSDFF